MEEIWKDIEGYEGIYQVSNLGRVKSLDRYVQKLGKFNYFFNGKPVAITDNGAGYKLVSLSKLGRKNHYIHRLVAKAFLPNQDDKLHVNHKDGVKSNNNVSNLEWVTLSENMVHAYSTGLQKVGGQKTNAIAVHNIVTGEKFETIKQASDYYGIKYGLLKMGLKYKIKNPNAIQKNPLYINLCYTN